VREWTFSEEDIDRGLKVNGVFRRITDDCTITHDVADKIDAASQPKIAKFGEDDNRAEGLVLVQEDDYRVTTTLIVKAKQIGQIGTEVFGDTQPLSKSSNLIEHLLTDL
jgi:hypothetical protein